MDEPQSGGLRDGLADIIFIMEERIHFPSERTAYCLPNRILP